MRVVVEEEIDAGAKRVGASLMREVVDDLVQSVDARGRAPRQRPE